MKKLIISALFAMGVMGAYAQTAEAPQAEVPLTKSGYKFLPEAGDYALGVSANPFLNYLGNALNGSAANAAPTFNGTTIYGKYFLSADQAIRARLNINTGSDTHKQTVRDDFAFNQPGFNGQTVVDVRKTSGTNVELNLGYEFRRGYRRVQGFYGAELGLGYNTQNTQTYEYANPITADNQTPTNGYGMLAQRTLENNPGNTFTVSLGGFVGVEYFILPKLSIGGEFFLNFNTYMTGQGERTIEEWDANLGQVLESSTRQRAENSNGLRFRTNNGGNLFMMFYF